MASEQVAMNTVANNLANVNTTGFKASEVQFEELINTQNANGSWSPQGVQVASTEMNNTQGTIQQTGNTWDLAINGAGYFPLTNTSGQEVYSRVGSFNVNAQGQIVNPNGLVLAGGITVPQGEQNIQIGQDGTIYGTPPNSAQPVALGQIQLVGFANPQGLTDQGQGVYAASTASGPALRQTGSSTSIGLGAIEQGSLETSNVNMVQEMVNMISTQRAYESGAKVITAADQMLGYANNLVK
jgi:flagellar basal-body rod protein FlgG